MTYFHDYKIDVLKQMLHSIFGEAFVKMFIECRMDSTTEIFHKVELLTSRNKQEVMLMRCI